MSERSKLIDWVRGELVGPSRRLVDPVLVEFQDRDFTDPVPLRNGPLGWRPTPDNDVEEILYFQRETPHRKYGAGVLHPGAQVLPASADQVAVQASDTLGIEPETDDLQQDVASDDDDHEEAGTSTDPADPADDFEVTSPDVRHPSTMGISFCVRLTAAGRVIVRMPIAKRFAWQDEASPDFPLNGRYERCTRNWSDEEGRLKSAPIWRRRSALLPETVVTINRNELVAGEVVRRDITMPDHSPINLRLEVFPRRIEGRQDLWLLTVVLRNSSQFTQTQEPREAVLYQTYFELVVEGGALENYPESQRPFSQLDPEEQSLSLLYRESATWGIGHGCAAGWDSEPQQAPTLLYADVMPAVQTPSMTPDIKDARGNQIKLSMRELAALPDEGQGGAWQPLTNVAAEYGSWIERRRAEVDTLPTQLRPVASRHLDAAASCLVRINRGIDLLRSDDRVRKAFRLANLAIVLQQIATKQLVSVDYS